jgi:hypothetical protein
MLSIFVSKSTHITVHRQYILRVHSAVTIMKLSNYALAAAVLATSANAFAGSQVAPRFGLQVCDYF